MGKTALLRLHCEMAVDYSHPELSSFIAFKEKTISLRGRQDKKSHCKTVLLQDGFILRWERQFCYVCIVRWRWIIYTLNSAVLLHDGIDNFIAWQARQKVSLHDRAA